MNFIKIYEDSLDEETCDLLINILETNEKTTDGVIHNGVNKQFKNTKDLHSHIWKNEYTLLDQKIYNELHKKLHTYFIDINTNNDTFIHPYDNLNDSGFQIQKYFKNEGFYKYHNDFYLEGNKFRTLTYLWYLNDVEEGGETEFLNLLKIKPKKGCLVIFPSCWTYQHRGCMPTSNDKYILTGWLYGSIK
jgi:hypothetical protein